MLTIRKQEQQRSGIFIVNFKHISHIALVFPFYKTLTITENL